MSAPAEKQRDAQCPPYSHAYGAVVRGISIHQCGCVTTRDGQRLSPWQLADIIGEYEDKLAEVHRDLGNFLRLRGVQL